MATDYSDPDLESSTHEKKDVVHDEHAPVESYEPVKWNFNRVVAVAALCIAYVGSQAILYFVGGGLTYISASIHTDVGNWLLTANTLVVAGTVPFVGYMTDLLGRRYVTIGGALLLIISSIVMATTKSLGSAITGMAIGGVGAGICELTAIAGVAEITPVKWRGVTLALVTFSILPFIPQLTYVEVLELHSTWRWTFCIAGVWNFVGFLGLIFCYHPPPRHNVDGLSKMEILKQIDYMGAFLSFGGVALFLVGLQAGGYQYPWKDGKVLGPLIVGIIMIVLFPLWEWKGTKTPMVPGAIFKGQNVVAISLVVVFIAGMNFYAVLGFFPIMLTTLYPAGHPLVVGYRGIGYPIAILVGACLVNTLLSYTKGHVREMFFIAATIMTAFSGALAASTPFNPDFAVVMSSLTSFGIGAIIVPALSVALYACPDRFIGTTAALSLSSRFLGGSVGTAIYFNIFNTKITAKLPKYVATAAVEAGLPLSNAMDFVVALLGPGGVSAAEAVPGVTPEILGAAGLATRWAYADSFAYVWYTTIAFGVISMICCAFLPNIRRFMTDRVAVVLH